MGSKKILEEMYGLVTAQTGESIEEKKFNNSILNSLKVRSAKERNAVLNELLVMLKSGNESIGRVSNGNFYCFPDIIETIETVVIKRFETEKFYKENKADEIDQIYNEDKADNEDAKNINELIERFDELSDDEFASLLNNLGNMDESEMAVFLENYKKNQEPLVESGIKDSKEIEEDEKHYKLMRAIQGKDAEIRAIASLMISIESEFFHPNMKKSCIMKLYDILNKKDLSEKTRKFCEELGIFDTIKRLMETINDPQNVATLNVYERPLSDDESLVVSTQTGIWQEALGFDRKLAQLKRSYQKGNYALCTEILRENGMPLDLFEQSEEKQDLVFKQVREQKKFTVAQKHGAKLSKARQDSEEVRKDKSEQIAAGSEIRVKKPNRIRNLRAVRSVSQLGTRVNEGGFKNNPISNNGASDIQINDYEFGNYFNHYAVQAVVSPFKAARKKGDVEPAVVEMLVDSAKQMTTRIGRIKKLLVERASKDKTEEAAATLFDLAAELSHNGRNDGNTRDSISDNGKIQEDLIGGEELE